MMCKKPTHLFCWTLHHPHNAVYHVNVLLFKTQTCKPIFISTCIYEYFRNETLTNELEQKSVSKKSEFFTTILLIVEISVPRSII